MASQERLICAHVLTVRLGLANWATTPHGSGLGRLELPMAAPVRGSPGPAARLPQSTAIEGELQLTLTTNGLCA